MKQFCPKCQKWQETDERLCRDCGVMLYSNEEYGQIMSQNKKPNVYTKKDIEKKYSKGVTMLALGITALFLGGMSILSQNSALVSFLWMQLDLNLDTAKTIAIALALSGVIAGIILIIFGSNSIHKYNIIKPRSNHQPTNIQSQEKPLIVCPYCKSNNTARIQSLERMGSVLLTGLASGKVGKQWHCNNCNSNF